MMFNPLKGAQQAKGALKARAELKKIQKEMSSVTTTVNVGNVEVFVTGEGFPSFKVKSVKIDGEENSEVAEAVNKASRDIQMKVAKKMMQDGKGFGEMMKGMGG